MKTRFVLYLLLILFGVVLYTPGLVKAQDTSEAFTQYSNPHSICDYYRKSGYVIERESDNECLTSLSDGGFKVYTQYYYSGKNWCYKLTQKGQTLHENCIPIPGRTTSTNSTEDYAPYLFGGMAIFVVIVIVGASSAGAKARALKKKRRGGYGWEEAVTTTTDKGEDTTKGPGVGKSQGGIGLHQGEPNIEPVASQLERLVKLRKDGSITYREFNLAKNKLLK